MVSEGRPTIGRAAKTECAAFRTLPCDAIRDGFAYGYLTSLLVVLGAILGREMVKPPLGRMPARDAIAAMAQWDGAWYREIVEHGYTFAPRGQSSLAFLPAYPLIARALEAATGMRTDLALVIVAQLCFVATCVVAAAYTRQRFPQRDGGSGELASLVVLSLGLFPAGIFLRMAYSEALFLLLTVLVLLGIERKWHPLAIALLVGLATATRPVGAALFAPLVMSLWKESRSRRAFVGRLAIYGLIASLGMLGYCGYLWAAFGDPLALAAAQYQWRIRPEAPLAQRLLDLATLEPLRSAYNSSSPGYWGRQLPGLSPLLNLSFANPIYFLAAAVLLAIGGLTRWLNRYELSLGIGLLLIPYVTRGHEMCMASAGRFTCVVFPCYLVMARLLERIGPTSALVLAAAAVLLGIYAALFAAGYGLI